MVRLNRIGVLTGLVAVSIACLVILAALGQTRRPFAQERQLNPLKLVETIPLPSVEGRIDHLAVDVRNKRLFVAALGNNTLEVIDLAAGKRVYTVRGLQEPQGVAYVWQRERIYVANGKGEGVDVFDSRTYAKIASIKLGSDTDNLRIDPQTFQLIAGYGNGGLAFIESRGEGETIVKRVPLFGHPESFQIDPKGRRIYVNVPSAKAIQVYTIGEEKPTGVWVIGNAEANYPMTLDAEHGILLVGCRNPPRICFFDVEAGKIKTSTPTVEDVDDMFYDAALQRVYVIGGGGGVDVLEYRRRHEYHGLARVATAPGARTGLFVPAFHRLYVAVPHRGSQQAEIRVYETQP